MTSANDKKISASVIENAKRNIADTIGKYVDLKKKGAEYEACCPFHKEKTPSFTVTPEKEFFYCFGCGASGDAVDFVMEYENIGFPQAVERIVGKMTPQAAQAATQRAPAKPVEAPEWTPVVPVPADITLQPKDIFNRPKGNNEWERLVASRRWAYRDANGDLIGYIFRFDLPGGGKDVMPQSFCVSSKTGEMSWRWMSFAKPRPLYGLDKLAAHPAAQVMLVEGEKACDAAQERYEAVGISRDKLITVSWPGGGKAVKHTDWAPLHGRNVGLWPDADQKDYGEGHQLEGQRMPMAEQPGVSCMLNIAELLADKAKSLKIIEPPADVPDGWDLADDLPEGFSLLAHTRAAAMPVADFVAKHPKPEQVVQEAPADLMPWDDAPPDYMSEDIPLASPDGSESDAEAAPAAPPAAKPPAPALDDDELVNNAHFTILGYDGGTYYLFQHEKRQVMAITKGDLSDVGLIELADLYWWEMNFSNGKGGIEKKAVAQWLFRLANARGIYNPDRIRGRGAWKDKDRNVYHHGSYLTVDGVQTEITRIKSAYVYPMARELPAPAEQPMTDAEGRHLVEVAELVRWSRPGSAALMAGWVMLAPICGALGWRPHIWITGAAGSGKSTVQNKYCAGLTRGINVYAQGNSTEAGIRQKLKADALPVLLDEAESNNERDKQRIENIMGMIRQTSSESQAETLKGSVSGDSQHYQIRSMFCLASINVNLPTKADIDRLTKLVIKAPKDVGEDHWPVLEAELNRIDQDEGIASRLLARSLGMMPVILKSIEVFRKVAAKHFGSQRDGDQFGTLLAGCWCLKHSTVPGELDAAMMIDEYVWDEHTEDQDQDDSTKALSALLGAKIRMGGGLADQTVYELVRECSSAHRHGTVDVNLAEPMLRRHGIIADVTGGRILFGTSVQNLMELIEKMPAITDLRGQLLRISGAERCPTASFNGTKSKCVSVPLDPILGESKADDGDEPF